MGLWALSPQCAHQLDYNRVGISQASSMDATGIAMEADAANQGIAVSNSHHPEPIASSSQRAADSNVVQHPTRAKRQHPTVIQDIDSPSTALGDHPRHLQRVHNTSTAALDSIPNPKSANALRTPGHANDTSAAMPQSEQTFQHQEPVKHRQHGKEDCLSWAAAAEDAQTQEGLIRSKHLQSLEAAAASWRQRCGSNKLASASQPVVLDSNQTGLSHNDEVIASPAAQSWQPQHALNDLEVRPSMPEIFEEGARFGSDTGGLATATPEHSERQSALSVTVGIPPPPSRPLVRSQAKNKVSWLAALRGDAPPWLL